MSREVSRREIRTGRKRRISLTCLIHNLNKVEEIDTLPAVCVYKAELNESINRFTDGWDILLRIHFTNSSWNSICSYNNVNVLIINLKITRSLTPHNDNIESIMNIF